MKKKLICILFCTIFFISSFATSMNLKNNNIANNHNTKSITILTSFDAYKGATTTLHGLTWDGTYLLYVEDLEYGGGVTIHRIRPTGSYYYGSPLWGIFDPKGLTYSPNSNCLWLVENKNGHPVFGNIFKISYDTNLAIIDWINSPYTSPTGLTWDGSYLWNVDSYSDTIYKISTDGTIIDSFPSPGTSPTGLTWDGTYLWNADNQTDMIYKLDTDGNVIDIFPSPGSSPEGLTWDGDFLWNIDSDTNKIYKLGTSGYSERISPPWNERDDLHQMGGFAGWDYGYETGNLYQTHTNVNCGVVAAGGFGGNQYNWHNLTWQCPANDYYSFNFIYKYWGSGTLAGWTIFGDFQSIFEDVVINIYDPSSGGSNYFHYDRRVFHEVNYGIPVPFIPIPSSKDFSVVDYETVNSPPIYFESGTYRIQALSRVNTNAIAALGGSGIDSNIYGKLYYVDIMSNSDNIPNLEVTPKPLSHDFGNRYINDQPDWNFNIWNSGGGTLYWTINENCNWLDINPLSGDCSGADIDSINVSIDLSVLNYGHHETNFTVNSNAGNITGFIELDVVNAPPYTPYNETPSNGSTTISLNTQLTWVCGDLDNDPLVYDVYFGDTNPPPLVASGQSGNTYNPGTLDYSTYYWQIVVHDDEGHSTIGPIWHFNTMANNPPNIPNEPIGQTNGQTSTLYWYETYTVDIDGDQIRYGWDKNGDFAVDFWSNFMNSSTYHYETIGWAYPGTYEVRVKAEDVNGDQSDFSTPLTVVISGSNPDPIVETLDATEIEDVTVWLHGKLIFDGGFPCQVGFRVREKGEQEWIRRWMNGNDYFSGDEFSDFWGPWNYITFNTTYEFQAGARNAPSESWGETKEFTTKPVSLPIIETLDPTIAPRTIYLNGKVIEDGGFHCWCECRYRIVGSEDWLYPTYGVWAYTGETFSISVNYDEFSKHETYETQAFGHNSAGEMYNGIKTFVAPNVAPDIPKLDWPKNGEIVGQVNSIGLSVWIFDLNRDYMDTYFYDDSDNLIGIHYDKDIISWVDWNDLVYDTTYRWYVIVNDRDGLETRGPPEGTWSFSTSKKSRSFELFLHDFINSFPIFNKIFSLQIFQRFIEKLELY